MNALSGCSRDQIRFTPYEGVIICAFVFFFFQAEDGIRDVAVTGVQTCALPISGSESSLGDEACGLLAVQCEVTLVPEGNGQKARNLARVHGAGKSFFLGFRAKENWGFLDEGFVIFRELEGVFLECFPEVVQFRIVVVAGSARGLVLPGERRNGRTLGSRRQYRREHNQGRNYRKETTVPRMVSHHNRSS